MVIGWIRELVAPSVPEPVLPQTLRRLARACIALDLVLAIGNVVTRFGLGPEADVHVYDVFLAYNLPAHALALAMLVSIARSSCELPVVRTRLRILIAAWAWTCVISNWIIGGLAIALNFSFAMILLTTARLLLGGRLGTFCLAALVAGELVCAALRIAGVFPDHSAIPDYALVDGVYVFGGVAWRSIALAMIFLLVGYIANRFRTSEHQLRIRNKELEAQLSQSRLFRDPSPIGLESTASAPIYSGETTLPKRTAPRLALDVGTRLGRYEIVRDVGAGAMGVVFEAVDTELDRRVALKIVKPHKGNLEAARGRLRREAQAMARMLHPNVVTIFDIGAVNDELFIAMELVHGGTLRTWVGARRPWRDELATLVAAGRGLAAAHAAGVVHRDFKPDNVLVRDDGIVRVSDFGLAREAATDSISVDPQLTATGAIAGTAVYLAPEAFDGTTDPSTDQFAFAVTAFEVFEGKRPFETGATIHAHRANLDDGRRAAWTRRDVPATIRAAIDRALSIDPAKRWPSMTALCDALDRTPRRRWLWLAAAAFLLAGAAATAFVAWPNASRSDWDFEAGVPGGTPAGWVVSDSRAIRLVTSTDRPRDGNQCGLVEPVATSSEPVSVVARIPAEPWRGMRVRVRTSVRTDGAPVAISVFEAGKEKRGWGGFSTTDAPIVANEWVDVPIVLSIDERAEYIRLTVYSTGATRFWIDAISIEPAPTSLPTQPALAPLDHDLEGEPTAWIPTWLQGTTVARSTDHPHGGVACVVAESPGVGAVSQRFDAQGYRGRRIRASVYIRIADRSKVSLTLVADHDVFIEADAPPQRPGGWERHVVEADVSADARSLELEVSVEGKAWIDDVAIEAVSRDASRDR